VLLINRRGCELLGRPETELIGASWVDVAVSPDDRERVAGAIAREFARTQPARDHEFLGESRVRTVSGADRLIDWNGITVPDPASGALNLICSGDDVTERRAAEDAVRQLRTLLDEAQAVAHIGNYVVGWPESPRDFWSPEVYRIFGFEPGGEPLNAATLGRRVHPDDVESLRATYETRAGQQGVFESDFRIVLPGGEVRHVHTKYQIERTPLGALQVLGTVIDVTDSVRAAEEAHLSQQRMAHVSTLATMGEMAAGFAHEINQPLAAIANFAQAARRLLAADPGDLGDVREALQQIAQQALRAGEIIRRMRSLVKRQATQHERVSVCELFDDVVGFCAHDAHMHDVRVRLHCEAGMPELSVDRVQIQQVILNLLRNAIDAVKDGPVESREISIHCMRVDGECRIEVCDRGPGVPAEIVPRIFDPFVTTKSTGTGLGLAISRSIIQAHQGRIGYRANQPGGACFQITLPIENGRLQ
jgi:PAS domain S-box-containing protein